MHQQIDIHLLDWFSWKYGLFGVVFFFKIQNTRMIHVRRIYKFLFKYLVLINYLIGFI